MSIKSSPEFLEMAVGWAVRRPVEDAVDWAVSVTASRAVWEAVNEVVYRAVAGAVHQAVLRAVRVSPPHPNLQRIVAEVRQAQGRTA